MELTSDFFPKIDQGFHRRGIDAQYPRHARNEIRRGLGAGRNFQLQTASERPPIFHAQGCARADRVRDFSQHDGAAATTACRWSPSAGLRQRFRFRSARSIPAQRADFAAARTRFAAGEVRSAQAKTRSRRFVRSGTQTCAAKISATNRDRDFAKRRRDSRHAQCFATARALAANPDQSGARAGNRRGRGNCRRNPRARHTERKLVAARSNRGRARRRQHGRFVGVQRRDCRACDCRS